MAKGDKNKKEKSDGGTADALLTTLPENCSMSSAASEANGDREAPLEPVCLSAPSLDRENRPESELKGPFLANIIVQRYEGERCGELFHGKGVVIFQGGHEYKGSFAEGLMHGHGEYIWADGIKYEGDFVSNALMGHGTYSWTDGSTYEGEVCYGIRHGIGTYKCAKTSSVYKGQWYRGKRHGKGTIYYSQGVASWYEGDWENNCREGWGMRCYPSGNIYQGQWKNNVQHGEGTMRWIQLGQQYSGQWVNGVQHGHGTHTWFLRRVPGSQYPLRNEYKGEFVQGLRHGQGTFSYASGAVYSGEWNHNKKHGQNGRIFEGEFINDRMAEFPAFFIDGTKTPDLSGIRTHSPPSDGSDLPRRAKKSGGTASLLGPDIALSIETLLNQFPEAQRDQELRQVEFAIMRHITLLRMIYSFYGSLGHDHSPDNTFLLTRLQFWRFLKDCGVHLHGITLVQMDRLIDDDTSTEKLHSPFSTMLLRQCLSYIVIAAYHIYHKDTRTSKNVLVECFSKLMKQNIIPNAKNVKGPLFCHHLRAVIGLNYIDRCWEIYQVFCKANNTTLSNQTMTARHFIWMLKDLGLLDSELTTTRMLEILSSENPAIYNSAHGNLDLEITFLEFFEALLGCVEVKTIDGIKTSKHFRSKLVCQDETVRTSGGERRESPLLGRQASPHTCADVEYKSTVQSSNLISPGAGSAKSPGISPVLLEAEEELRNEEENWIKKTNCFFTQIFFPAYKHNLLLREEVQEERLRQSTKNRTALEKAKENARLREAEQEERCRAEEKEEEEKGNVPEDLNHSTPALMTPVAFSNSESLKPSPPSGSKKKKN
ncbi:radial spoke head 10 homolog B isoform X2 [Pygocentrus nattereri]|uniref:radial spoke head 10 homolog B isoform X2 n=1 Tax=Pygocentrus nattereri TaxID=42514 RepID=UPI001890D770|nr:radial spoke head 10 homolog B isoform X2 [Pygocentrus nattereri]